jgi:hypothetical protein
MIDDRLRAEKRAHMSTDMKEVVDERTALALENFFSVLTTPPLRCAAFKADAPLMTFSRGAAPVPRTLLPIFVTVSHSSDIVDEFESCGLWRGKETTESRYDTR